MSLLATTLVIGASTGVGLLTEFLNRRFIYSLPVRRLKARRSRQRCIGTRSLSPSKPPLVHRMLLQAYEESKTRLAGMRAQLEDVQSKPRTAKNTKVLETWEKDLDKDISKENTVLTGLRMRSTIWMLALNIGVWWLLSSIFNNMALLRLPFEPFSFIQGMTHRGVPGDDPTEAGFTFVFVLASAVLKPVLAAVFGAEEAPAGSGLMETISKAVGEPAAAAAKR